MGLRSGANKRDDPLSHQDCVEELLGSKFIFCCKSLHLLTVQYVRIGC